MDKEERKTINQGQEDEMVTDFYISLVKCEEFISIIYYSREVEKYIKTHTHTRTQNQCAFHILTVFDLGLCDISVCWF